MYMYLEQLASKSKLVMLMASILFGVNFSFIFIFSDLAGVFSVDFAGVLDSFFFFGDRGDFS